MEINWIDTVIEINDLKDYDRNPRRISKDQFNHLVKSIKEDGYHQRLLVNTDGTIIGGHQRKKALLASGLSSKAKITVLMPDKMLRPEDIRRLLIRDNLPYGEFDFDILASDFDVGELIEWGMPEEWLPITSETTEGLADDDSVPDVPIEPKTILGDIYALGNHRLMCGDSTSIDDVEKLMGGIKSDMIFTDPPYGISILGKDGKIGGRSKGVSPTKYEPFIGDDSTETARDAYYLCETLDIPVQIFWGANHYGSSLPDSSCWIVWDKNNGSSDFADAELAWTNQNTAVRIFKHTWSGMFKASECNQSRVHPTQKPIALAEWCFEQYGKDALNVIDLFGGSGSTLIACEKTNRKCFMMELSPHYCDVIIKRWEDFTGKKAELIT